MKKPIRFLIIAFLFLLLILVRAKSSSWFYDPFTEYFKNDYLYKGIPDFDLTKLLFHILYRYAINTSISLAIIYLFFKGKYLKFSLWFYVLAFVVLIFFMTIVLQFSATSDYRFLFYIRRFLIHPIFVLLLIPAFFQKNKSIE